MRVFFLSQAPGVSGGERVALQALARIPDIEVVVSGPGPVCRFAEDLGFESIVFEKKRSHRLTHAARVVNGGLRVRRLVRSFDSDLLYANGTRAIPYSVIDRALGGPPLLFHHHGLLTGGPVRTLVRASDRWVDSYVVPSEICAEPFRRKDKINVVANGVDLNHFSPAIDRARAKRELGIPPDVPVVGTVTRPNPTKGMGAFLELAERLRETEAWFLLAGGPAFPHEVPHYQQIRDRAAALGNRVVLTGKLEDPRRAYWAMDVFVHLGEPEVQPLAMIEAMSSALPVVGYGWGGLPLMLGDDALLVKPHIEDAADAVQELISNTSLAADLSARVRDRCEASYSIDRTAESLGAVLRATIR